MGQDGGRIAAMLHPYISSAELAPALTASFENNVVKKIESGKQISEGYGEISVIRPSRDSKIWT